MATCPTKCFRCRMGCILENASEIFGHCGSDTFEDQKSCNKWCALNLPNWSPANTNNIPNIPQSPVFDRARDRYKTLLWYL